MTYHHEETYNGSDLEITVLGNTGTATENGQTVTSHTVWGIIDAVNIVTDATATDNTVVAKVTDLLQALKDQVDDIANATLHALMIDAGYVEQADPIMSFDVATGVPGELIISWDFDIDHDNFIVDRDTVDTFATFVNVVNAAGIVAPVSDTGLSTGIQYFYRAKSQKTGKDDSDYVYADKVAP